MKNNIKTFLYGSIVALTASSCFDKPTSPNKPKGLSNEKLEESPSKNLGVTEETRISADSGAGGTNGSDSGAGGTNGSAVLATANRITTKGPAVGGTNGSGIGVGETNKVEKKDSKSEKKKKKKLYYRNRFCIH